MAWSSAIWKGSNPRSWGLTNHGYLGGGFKHVWGNHPIWRTYFSNGLVQPPTCLERIADLPCIQKKTKSSQVLPSDPNLGVLYKWPFQGWKTWPLFGWSIRVMDGRSGREVNWEFGRLLSCWFPYKTLMASQPTPPNVPPPRNKALWSGLINHWFPLIRPYETLISGGGYVRGGLVDQP